MPLAPANGIDVFYDEVGDRTDPTILLISGLGSQMVAWDAEFCAGLAGRGFHVVRFDNRDVGMSTRFDARVDVLGLLRARAAGEPLLPVPYLLGDMAGDAVGLLDHLGVERAHVLGVSMGGMIAQTVAIAHPARVLSLTSIMSTTGDLDVGAPTSDASRSLLSPPARTREEYQDAAVRNAGVWGSPGLFDVDRLRRVAGESWDRGYDPSGTARQLAAITASGSRSGALARIAVPTLVIHGTADTLVQPSGGERTAEVIPDAKLLMIEGMGHDLAPPLWPTVIDAIAAHAAEHAP
ncbi:MAG TPA: alpha/beta fold hydrolase [Acidimicrobiales bacterium]|nr:alpha/beta fold hydrolase [Acidimicrobiales bacterium]